ncbi:MAG TPA: putative quinol monooxygenase [Bacteroidales bacterium]|nr:putative quinol monooxygenase [Bacteroidales bacterium]HPI68272.1 putative quinol monooxygenase [Bacteroidales bacterium]
MKTKIFVILFFITVAGISCNQNSSVNPPRQDDEAMTINYEKMIIARVFVKPGMESDFISAAKGIIEKSNQEERCSMYMLYQDPYEKSNFLFVERYENQAAVDAHFATPYFAEFGEISGEMISKPMDIKILDIAREN